MVIVLFLDMVSSTNKSFISHEKFSDNRVADLLRKSKLPGNIYAKENKTSQTSKFHKQCSAYKNNTPTLEKH